MRMIVNNIKYNYLPESQGRDRYCEIVTMMAGRPWDNAPASLGQKR